MGDETQRCRRECGIHGGGRLVYLEPFSSQPNVAISDEVH